MAVRCAVAERDGGGRLFPEGEPLSGAERHRETLSLRPRPGADPLPSGGTWRTTERCLHRSVLRAAPVTGGEGGMNPGRSAGGAADRTRKWARGSLFPPPSPKEGALSIWGGGPHCAAVPRSDTEVEQPPPPALDAGEFPPSSPWLWHSVVGCPLHVTEAPPPCDLSPHRDHRHPLTCCHPSAGDCGAQALLGPQGARPWPTLCQRTLTSEYSRDPNITAWSPPGECIHAAEGPQEEELHPRYILSLPPTRPTLHSGGGLLVLSLLPNPPAGSSSAGLTLCVSVTKNMVCMEGEGGGDASSDSPPSHPHPALLSPFTLQRSAPRTQSSLRTPCLTPCISQPRALRVGASLSTGKGSRPVPSAPADGVVPSETPLRWRPAVTPRSDPSAYAAINNNNLSPSWVSVCCGALCSPCRTCSSLLSVRGGGWEC